MLPSWCEGYGYPPLEGFAHGTPAIVSDLPALRETAGAGALYVPPGDVSARWPPPCGSPRPEPCASASPPAAREALRGRTWEAAARALARCSSEAAA